MLPISLFSVGLKLDLPLSNRQWLLPMRLAFASMPLTLALIAAVGILVLGLAPGAAILWARFSPGPQIPSHLRGCRGSQTAPRSAGTPWDSSV